MKRIAVLLSLAVLAVASPLLAQSRSVDVIGYATWTDPNGDGTFSDGIDDIDVNFDSEQGFGVAVNVFWGSKISTEFAASVVEPDVAFESTNPAIPAFTGGSLEMIPITATLQYHFSPDSRFDPYVGAGAAYVLFDELDAADDLDDVDLTSIDFDDDVGFVINAGFSFDFTPNLALYVDGKYVPVSSSATASFATGPGQETDVDINPLILGVGLGWQF